VRFQNKLYLATIVIYERNFLQDCAPQVSGKIGKNICTALKHLKLPFTNYQLSKLVTALGKLSYPKNFLSMK
jgi:hypothetical protein